MALDLLTQTIKVSPLVFSMTILKMQKRNLVVGHVGPTSISNILSRGIYYVYSYFIILDGQLEGDCGQNFGEVDEEN